MIKDVPSMIEEEISRLNVFDKNPSMDDIYTLFMIIHHVEEFLHAQKKEISVDTLQYNIPFWVQAILRKPNIGLRVDDPEQVLYEVKPNTPLPFLNNKLLDTLISLFPDRVLWSLFIKNLSDIAHDFRSNSEAILSAGDKKHCVVLSNHATWLNLPLIAYCLHEFVGIPREDIYILLGPAITTNAFGMAGSNRFANIIKTVPDTPRGNIDYHGVELIRKRALRTVLKLIRSEDVERKYILVAPSGTTDSYDGKNGGFQLIHPSQGTKDFISLLSSQTSQMIIGVNDYAVYPGNAHLKRGDVLVDIVPPVDQNNLHLLPRSVIDMNGKTIAKWK